MLSFKKVMIPGRCSDPPAISIGRRVLNFSFLRNRFTNVMSESLQLLKLVFTQCNASTYRSLCVTVKFNASGHKCVQAYCRLVCISS